MSEQTWTQSEKLLKLNLKLCKVHTRLFSGKPGGYCANCGMAETTTKEQFAKYDVMARPPLSRQVIEGNIRAVPHKTCTRGHIRPITIKSCSDCAKITRAAKSQKG